MDYVLQSKNRVADWIKRQDSSICCLKVSHFRAKDTHWLKVREWKKIFYANTNEKSGVAILISCKVDSKTKSLIKDRGAPTVLHSLCLQYAGLWYSFSKPVVTVHLIPWSSHRCLFNSLKQVVFAPWDLVKHQLWVEVTLHPSTPMSYA